MDSSTFDETNSYREILLRSLTWKLKKYIQCSLRAIFSTLIRLFSYCFHFIRLVQQKATRPFCFCLSFRFWGVKKNFNLRQWQIMYDLCRIVVPLIVWVIYLLRDRFLIRPGEFNNKFWGPEKKLNINIFIYVYIRNTIKIKININSDKQWILP